MIEAAKLIIINNLLRDALAAREAGAGFVLEAVHGGHRGPLSP